MANKNKPPKSKQDDPQAYLGVAIVFFAVGVTFLLSESTRTTGLPFVILGITFFILSQQKPTDKRKK